MVELPEFAISLHAPWAWAVMYGGKDVENRSHGKRKFPQTVLGDIWIHASKWPGSPVLKAGTAPWNDWYAEFDQVALTLVRTLGIESLPKLAQQTILAQNFPSIADGTADRMRGHIVGRATVMGYRTPDDPPVSPWYIPGHLGILLRDPRPLTTPVPALGALGWWRPSAETQTLLRGAQ